MRNISIRRTFLSVSLFALSFAVLLPLATCATGERGRLKESSQPATYSCESRCLSGDCKNGTGKFEFADCSVYQGEFESGIRNGTGEYRFSSGTILKGYFKDGRPVGAFEYRFPEGAVFKGRIRQDMVSDDSGLTINGADGYLELNGERRPCRIRNLKLLCDATQQRIVRKDNRDPGAPEDLEPGEIKFLLLYAPGSARLLRNDEEFSVSSGYPLAPGDTIITREHAADIQGEGGFAIRLKPFSELYIPPDARKHRVLQLNRGSIIVDYSGEGPLPFRVRSGGINVDVKGTTFVVEAGDEKDRVKVRVLEGEVNLSRDDSVLDRIRQSDVEKYPELSEAIDQMEIPVSLKAGDEATATVLDSTEDADSLAKKAVSEPAPAVSEASEKELARDAQEASLMPVLPDEDFQEAREAGLSEDSEDREEAARSIEENYKKKVQTSGDDLEKQLKLSNKIDSAEEFKKAYPVLEVVHLNKGTRHAGSIIAQAGGLLFLFAPDGLYRLPIEEVDYVDYYNRDEMDMDILKNPSSEGVPESEK